MKRLLLLSTLISFLSVQAVFAMTAREIVQKSENLAKPKSAKSKVSMKITKGGTVMEKEFLLFQKTIDGEDKVLITFTKPTQIKVLTHTHKKGEDDQWLRLSSGKVKRLVGGDKSQSFVQSHMTYEDLESRDIDNYDYKSLADSTVQGQSCYTIEAIKKSGNKTYDRNILYIRKTDYAVLKIDFFQKSKLFKYLENKEIKTIEGIVTPMLISVVMADQSGKTDLVVEKVIYNTEIEDSKFSKEALR